MIDTPPIDLDLVLAERNEWERRCQAIYRRARRMLGAPALRVLDTETTGLDDSAEIVEIAILGGRGQGIMDSFVRPVGDIPAEVSAINNIYRADVAYSRPIYTLWDRIYTALDGAIVAIYSAEFDVRMLRQEAQRYNLPMPDFLPWCLKEDCKTVLCDGDGSARWPRLSAACEQLGVADVPGHRALSDTRATLGVLRKLAERASYDAH